MPLQPIKAENLAVDDLVQVEGWPKPARIQGVHIIFHMDNNMDLVVAPNADLFLVPE